MARYRWCNMQIFNDIAVFFNEAHYTAVLDAIGFSML
nr:MAG TPA: hypothetical protein [Caudoviricetes sp.]